MPWLNCRVELISRRAGAQVIAEEFEGRSLYECAWMALCTWCDQWFYDSAAEFLTIRHEARVWLVRQANVRAWRPLIRDDAARQVMHRAQVDDPEGKEKPQPGEVWL